LSNETDIAFGQHPDPDGEKNWSNSRQELPVISKFIIANTDDVYAWTKTDFTDASDEHHSNYRQQILSIPMENGEPRRLNEQLFTSNYHLCTLQQRHQDFTNGEDIKNTTYHIAGYSSKSQSDSPDLSAR
jgi:hypothetical protein